MSRINKTYTEEYKRTLVNLIINGKTISEVSREYGVATSNLVGWKKLYSNINTGSEENITLADYKKMQKEFTSLKEECDILKKGFKNIREKLDDTKIFEVIENLKEVHSQEKMCIIFQVNRSSYYSNLNRIESKTKIRNSEIAEQVLEIYEEHNGIYGAPKIHASLNRLDVKCSLKLVQRIMKKLEIKSVVRKKYKPLAFKNKKEPSAGNLLEQDFTTKGISEKIVGDITYIKTKDYGWCYLASFLDLHTSEIIGWEFSHKMTAELVLKALNKATSTRKLSGAIIHTDQGSQYTSCQYCSAIEAIGGKLSYSRKGNPYDNACIESFHSVLKKESIYLNKIRTFEETKESLFEYIEGWYNSRRIQKKLGYLSPLEFYNKLA